MLLGNFLRITSCIRRCCCRAMSGVLSGMLCRHRLRFIVTGRRLCCRCQLLCLLLGCTNFQSTTGDISRVQNIWVALQVVQNM